MAAIERFEEIKAWQQARVLTQSIDAITRNEQFKRDFALIDQIRRAAGSVMHKIAEGFDAGSDADAVNGFIRYLK